MEKICISGMGGISCAGHDLTESLANLFKEPMLPQKPSPRIGSKLLTPLYDLGPVSMEQNDTRTFSLLRKAFDEALKNSGLTSFPERTGICIGTTIDCQLNKLDIHAGMRDGTLSDFSALHHFINGNPAEKLKRQLKLTGPAATVSNACASGADAIALAGLWIASGRCDVAIAGGCDELNLVPVAGFHALGVTSMAPCRPFDRDRSGLNLGEGAGVVILESERFLHQRKHPADLRLAGFASSSDCYHITAPHPQGAGLVRAMKAALDMASLSPADIGFVNAHGTGTANNDPAEVTALCQVLGEDIRFHSTKTHTGHTLGAAGALEFIFTAMMLQQRKGSKAYRFENLPEEIPAAPALEDFHITEQAAMSTSMAFGGCNTALIASLKV